MEEEEANLGVGGSAPATNAGGEGATSSQPGVGKLFAFCLCSFFFFLNLDLGSTSFPFLVSRPFLDLGSRANHLTALSAAA